MRRRDVTYFPVARRWMYFASVLDIATRRVLGCWMAGVVSGACEQAGIWQPMGTVGSSADNALSESWCATLKREGVVS